MKSVAIIGGGHNGLAAAFYLAKAGLKVTLFEARDAVGGGAVTEEIHPGFRVPTLAHHASLRSDIVNDMELTRHGLTFLQSPIDVFAPSVDAPPLVIYRDKARWDAAYNSYRGAMDNISPVVAALLSAPAPRIDHLDGGDVLTLLSAGRGFRALDRKNAYRLLRWIPMPVADLTREWFESDLMCAAVAAPGLSGTMLGPRSAGSGLVLLLNEATGHLARASGQIRGGPGALTNAMAAAARGAGVDIQTGARVERIEIDNDRVAALRVNGRDIAADTVVSAVDPKTTFLKLIDPVSLMPDFLGKIRNYRANGTVAKINLALSALPGFGPAEGGHDASKELLSGRIHIGPDLDYLERAFDCAKYGRLSDEPWLDVVIPSVLDPDLAPRGAHVMSIYTHYAPYHLRDRDWSLMRDELLATVLAVLDRFAPGLRALVVAANVITPGELESRYGYFGGHIFHGELSLDQLVSMRPLLRHARYATPIAGLFLCSSGTHPGGFMSGANGKMAAREVARTLS